MEIHWWNTHPGGEKTEVYISRRIADLAYDLTPITVYISPSSRRWFFGILKDRMKSAQKSAQNGELDHIEGLFALKEIHLDEVFEAGNRTHADVVIQVEDPIYIYADDDSPDPLLDIFIPVVEYINMRTNEVELEKALFELKRCSRRIRPCLEYILRKHLENHRIMTIDKESLLVQKEKIQDDERFLILENPPSKKDWQAVFDTILKHNSVS
ncbi:MAG: hypothetical protein RTU92_04345 [Candidatus Thorarchaeota archaeon]